MKKFIIGLLLTFLTILSMGTTTGMATSDDNDSDITKGQITFYEEKEDNPVTEQSSSLPSNNTDTNKPNDTSKPKKTGLLPQTGEDFLKLLPYLIGISILILLILYRKEKKEHEA